MPDVDVMRSVELCARRAVGFPLDVSADDGETHAVFVSHAVPMNRAATRQRRGVFLLCVALCFWLFAFASHVHAEDDRGRHGNAPATCAFCLSLPTGAAAPAVLTVSATLSVAAVLVASLVAPVGGEVPSSYLSRGPPAI